MRLTNTRHLGPALCLRLTVGQHTFGLNVWGPGAWGRRYLVKGMYWRSQNCDWQ